jgi:acetylornithine deacetylase/succinyl-diaminopimelate desuccinylase
VQDATIRRVVPIVVIPTFETVVTITILQMTDTMPFDPVAFHREAVETPSHDDGDAMRSLLTETLRSAGCVPTVDSEGNILATRGFGNGEHIVLNTHMDTVSPHVPFEDEGDLVRGRGACDAKGPLAALLGAFLQAELEHGQLTLAVTPNEETTQVGGAHLGETLQAEGYIVGEPTGLDVCVAARGQFEGVVTISGESAHASAPGEGANAIRAVAPILQAMESYDDERGPGEHDLLGWPTLTPTTIEGGDAINQVPATCRIGFDRRTIPPEGRGEFLDELQEHITPWLPGDYGVRVQALRPDQPWPSAFATDRSARLVETLAATSGGEIRAFGAAAEAAYFADDAPTVIFGPGVLADEHGPVAHSQREYVRKAAIGRAADAVSETIETLL